MQIHYNSGTDLLYLRFDDASQAVVNRRVSGDVVLDIGRNDRLIGIEIMDASRHVRMDRLLPVTYETPPAEQLSATVRESPVRYTTTKRKRKER